MRLRTLRLAGFKSFAEPLQLDIQPGLSGIVGPNGCGKSNLLEALCWGMGETSFRHMRAQTMEDVVFAGSALRPPVAAAETRLLLELEADEQPSEELAARFALKAGHQIEIVRRLARGDGSVWQVNGAEARARDVQLLFADAASGARSLAFVRQGMIAELVTAKPDARRKILEEAAGVAGLYARRHEAELRLAATEQNLARAGDLLSEKTAQKNALAKQARAAARYRQLSDAIRRQESLLAYSDWHKTQTACAEADAQVETDSRALKEAESGAQEARRAHEEQTRAHGALQSETDAAQEALQAERHRAAGLAAAQEQTQARLADAQALLQQLKADANRAQSQSEDAAKQIKRLAEERAQLAAHAPAPRAAPPPEPAAQARAQDAVARAQAAWDAHQAAVSEAAARADMRAAQLVQWQQQTRSMEKNAAELKMQSQACEDAQRTAQTQKQEAAQQMRTLAAAQKQAQAQRDKMQKAARTSQARAQTLREQRTEWEQKHSQLQAQWETLQRLFPHAQNSQEPLLAHLQMDKSCATALAAVLGEDAQAGLRRGAQMWQELPALPPPPFPPGVRPLAALVRAPKALARFLAHVGLVDAAQGAQAQKQLGPGQILVSPAGDIWRWDGYAARAQATQDKAARFRQLQQGLGLPAALARADKKLAELSALNGKAEAQAAEAQRTAERAASAAAQAEEQHAAALEAQAALAQTLAQAEKESARLRDELARAEQDLRRQKDAEAQAEKELASLRRTQEAEDGAALRERLAEARAQLLALEARAAQGQAQGTSDPALQAERLARLQQEETEWQARAKELKAQLAELAERRSACEKTCGALAAERAKQDADLQSLTAAARAAASAQETMAARLEASAAALEKSAQAAAQAEAEQTALRERSIANRTRQDMLEGQKQEAARQIANRFQCAPQELAQKLELAADAALPDAEELKQKLEEAQARRGAMGEVNLLAQQEMERLTAELDAKQQQMDDLQRGLASLRQAIAAFNRESQSRMEKALREVKAHFQSLFASLFEGGEAQLRLTEPQRLLESGLEVVVRVPGKKKQSLALLSGGEQTLTALALMFAVFAANPAPICVLDEADSQLDDGNVGRFCRLLQKAAAETRICFWLITHHPLTMSRMDRLWGVTMQEPGVSHVSAISLQEAEQFADRSGGARSGAPQTQKRRQKTRPAAQ